MENINIKRINPEEVVGLFERLNIIPKAGSYFNENKTCACAIGVMALSNAAECTEEEERSRIFEYPFSNVYDDGYNTSYLSGIINGFDNRKIQFTSYHREIGYEDGKKVRDLLIEKGYEL